MAEGQGWMSNFCCSPFGAARFTHVLKLNFSILSNPLWVLIMYPGFNKIIPDGMILLNGGSRIRTHGPGKGSTVFKSQSKNVKKPDI
jgi:hypothetical protein